MSSEQNTKKIKLFIPKEINNEETRVALIPASLKKLNDKGFEVLIEKDAGQKAQISDKEYEEGGAKIMTNLTEAYTQADIVVSINPPQYCTQTNKHQIDNLQEGATWISLFIPQSEQETVSKMQAKKLNSFSLNLIPRTTRAQAMDVLSSQANLAGYKAVIMAAQYSKKIFPLMMTPAGTINPAKVIIMGVGVAGLQAIATAKRLGAQVEASDIRLATKEQVESLGAKFIEVEGSEDMEDEGGYAREATPEFLKKQAEEVAKRVAQADVVITTALIPGKKAPVLITEEMVKSMPTGSVIVDMAAPMGGNCALTKPGEIVEINNITIIGHNNLPAQVATNASQMFSKNIENFLLEITKDQKLNIDLENEIIKGSLVVHNGELVQKN